MDSPTSPGTGSAAFPSFPIDTPMENTTTATPSSPSSPSSSSLRSRRSSNLTLDMSALKSGPTAPVPTNTLLFTNLDSLDIFRPDNLATIRDLVAQSAPIHSWAPLRSFRRIIASFYSAADAARVRAVWDGESLLGSTCTVYFGRATPIDDAATSKTLALPDAGKLFFISPPPSPPHDWEMRLEDAPNKMVHAEDLADALAKLRHDAAATSAQDVAMDTPDASPVGFTRRSRSSTLVIYQPAQQTDHGRLPAIAVEDMTDDMSDAALNHATWATSASAPIPATPAPAPRPITMTHTARPPVELMLDA